MQKGRSGTLLCSYLLSLPQLPPSPQLDRSYSNADLARRSRSSNQSLGDEDSGDGWIAVGQGHDTVEVKISPSGPSTSPSTTSLKLPISTVPRSTSSSMTTVSRPSPPASLRVHTQSSHEYDPIDISDEGFTSEQGQQDRRDGRVDEVFKLHSSRRMKPTSTGRGVSIPSRASNQCTTDTFQAFDQDSKNPGLLTTDYRTPMVPLHSSCIHE